MTHAAASEIFERQQPWALSVAMAAIRRIGKPADGEEIRQVAQVTTWERALAFDPSRWVVKPVGDPFQLYAYPSVYGACLMVGYRGASGRGKTADGEWVALKSIAAAQELGGDSIEHGAVESAIDAASRGRLIASILHELPKRERWLIAEHYLGGVSLSAIADSLFTSPSSVSRIHASALNLLRIAVSRRGLKAGEWL